MYNNLIETREGTVSMIRNSYRVQSWDCSLSHIFITSTSVIELLSYFPSQNSLSDFFLFFLFMTVNRTVLTYNTRNLTHLLANFNSVYIDIF